MENADERTEVSALLDDKLLCDGSLSSFLAAFLAVFSTPVRFGENFRFYKLRGDQTMVELKTAITKDSNTKAARFQPASLRVCQLVYDTGKWNAALVCYREPSANKVVIERVDTCTPAECKGVDDEVTLMVDLQPSWVGRCCEKFAVYSFTRAWTWNLWWMIIVVSQVINVSLMVRDWWWPAE